MQRSALCISSLLAAAFVSSACNDLGECTDPERGRQTVDARGTIMYAGQAIMVASCASGCHVSTAKGAGRQGAPADMNFDLVPVAAGKLIKNDAGQATGVEVDQAQLAGLRSRQRHVFDDRENIWDQVDKGLMPPDGVGETYRAVAAGVKVLFGPASSCTRGEQVGFKESKGVLRQWLACGTPVVETVSADLPFEAVASDAGAPERASGAVAYSGSVGYQYPACAAAATAPSFDEIYEQILKTGYSCVDCHSGAAAFGNFDMGATADTAYTALTTKMSSCAATPAYVVPNDPSKSLLSVIVDGKASATARCGLEPMPLGMMGISDADLTRINAWINAGAPRTGGGSAAMGDAGVGDAGVADAAR